LNTFKALEEISTQNSQILSDAFSPINTVLETFETTNKAVETIRNLGKGAESTFANLNDFGKILPLYRVICIVHRVNS
jgi:hypothetical protein